jgi:hypothetical protein
MQDVADCESDSHQLVHIVVSGNNVVQAAEHGHSFYFHWHQHAGVSSKASRKPAWVLMKQTIRQSQRLEPGPCQFGFNQKQWPL